MRLFYAAYLSQENMRAYQALVDRLMAEVPGSLRSVPHQTHHLTLAFLGEIADSQLKACKVILESVASLDSFPLSLARPRVLKGRGRPRLICVDIADGKDRVEELQKSLSSALNERLDSIDLRPKPPHVTLARFNRNASRWQGRQVESALAGDLDLELPCADRFRAVDLVKSSLTPSGPIYETVARAELLVRSQ